MNVDEGLHKVMQLRAKLDTLDVSRDNDAWALKCILEEILDIYIADLKADKDTVE